MKKSFLPKLLAFVLILPLMMFIGCSDDDDDDDSMMLAYLMSQQGKNNGEQQQGNTDFATLTIQDDEKGYVDGGGTLASKSDKNASNGKFWESFKAEKAFIQYAVNASVAGDYTLTVHYSFAGWCENMRDCKVYINGKEQTEPLLFDYTGGAWKEWKDVTYTLHLQEGDNSISLDADIGKQREYKISVAEGVKVDSSSGKKNGDTVTGTVVNMPNIDYIKITATQKGATLQAKDKADIQNYFKIKVSSDNEKMGGVEASLDATQINKVTLSATANAGFQFDCWTGDATSKENPFTFTMTQNTNVKAHFIPQGYTKSSSLLGYATVCDDSATAYTITGGAGGENIAIASLSDLVSNKDKLAGNDSYIVTISGAITTTDDKSLLYNIGSNKTIFGSSGGELKNIEMRVSGDNVIVRNMKFGSVIAISKKGADGTKVCTPEGKDAFSINGGQFVWVDHCEFSSSLVPKDNSGNPVTMQETMFVDAEKEGEDGFKKDWYDGLLDIKNGARYITISNCYFHDHWKACLCGSSEDKANGDDALRITFSGNYFKDIGSRQPLVRWGKAHILGSLYSSESELMKSSGGTWNATAVDVRVGSEVLVEGCVFNKQKGAVGLLQNTSATPGKWTTRYNTGATDASTTNYEPSYTYKKPTSPVSEAQVISNAGVGKITGVND